MSRKSLYSVLLVAGFMFCLICTIPTNAQASSTATLSLSNANSYEISMHNHFSSWNWAVTYNYGTDIDRTDESYSLSATDSDGQTISRVILAFDTSSLGTGLTITSAYLLFDVTGGTSNIGMLEEYNPADAVSEMNLYNDELFGTFLGSFSTTTGAKNISLDLANFTDHGGMIYLGFRMQDDFDISPPGGLVNCTIANTTAISIVITYTGGGALQQSSTTITGIINTVIFFLPGFFLNMVVKRWGMIIGIAIMTILYFTMYSSFIWVMPIGLLACALMFFSEAD